MKKYAALLVTIALLAQDCSIDAMNQKQRRAHTKSYLKAVQTEEERLAADNEVASSNGWDNQDVSIDDSTPANTSSAVAKIESAPVAKAHTPELQGEESQIGKWLKFKTSTQSHLQCARTYLDELPTPNTKTKDSIGSQIRKAIDETTKALKEIAVKNGTNSIAALMQTIEEQKPLVTLLNSVLADAYDRGIPTTDAAEKEAVQAIKFHNNLRKEWAHLVALNCSDEAKRSKAVCRKIQAARHARNNHDADGYLSEEDYENLDDMLNKIGARESERLETLEKERAAALAREVAEQAPTAPADAE